MTKIWSCLGLYTFTIYVVEGDSLQEVKERLLREKWEPVSCQVCCVKRERGVTRG